VRGDRELRALEQRLGAKAPAGVAGLPKEQLSDLLAAINEARRRQAEELQAAGERAFSHVPRLLRMPIRRIMS
jgi:hypothetical protein